MSGCHFFLNLTYPTQRQECKHIAVTRASSEPSLHIYGLRKITGQCARSPLSYTGDVSNCFCPASSTPFSFRLMLSYNVTCKVP
jgi:hypothetical protein